MTIRWPISVVQSLARRRAVVVIGSGVSANAKSDDGRSPPTWGSFLVTAYKDLGRKVPHISKALKTYNYLEVCDYLKTEYNDGWADLIRKHFVDPQYRSAEIHEAIFELDSRITISLNFDDIYETYAIRATENTVVIKNYYDPDIRQAVAGSDRYVIKPHGTVNSISKMIFTLEQYAQSRIEHSSFYEVISSLLHTHTFVCIGCGLSDPDMKLIFEDYRYKHGESPHYMCFPSPVPSAQIDLVRKTRGINMLPYSPKFGHRELTESLKELAKTVATKRDELSTSQNW